MLVLLQCLDPVLHSTSRCFHLPEVSASFPAVCARPSRRPHQHQLQVELAGHSCRCPPHLDLRQANNSALLSALRLNRRDPSPVGSRPLSRPITPPHRAARSRQCRPRQAARGSSVLTAKFTLDMVRKDVPLLEQLACHPPDRASTDTLTTVLIMPLTARAQALLQARVWDEMHTSTRPTMSLPALQPRPRPRTRPPFVSNSTSVLIAATKVCQN